VPSDRGLEPALELRSYVAAVKAARRGESAGYGRRFVADRETRLATLPIGYGDGVRRAFTNNLRRAHRGRRYPLVGAVSMDNITVELGPDADERRLAGAPATIIGADGRERQTAEDLAARIGHDQLRDRLRDLGRVPRAYHRDGAPSVMETRRTPPRPLAALPLLSGADAWLVGGAVRDRLLGRSTRSISTWSSRPTRRATARALARRVGAPAFPLSEAFGAWRVIARDRSWQIDLAPLGGGDDRG
jgi:hypothetical protein